MVVKREAPSLIDLCVKTAIDNVRYLGDVGATELDLLGRILPHCTVDQLMHVENSTAGRNLNQITNKLWRKFYEKQFGPSRIESAVENMRAKKASFSWRQLYEAKLKERDQAQERSIDRIKQLYQNEEARKQSRQVQICTKVPPSSKRGFWGGSGPGYNVSNLKSNLMKKAKIECLNSREVRNIAAMKKNAIQKNHSVSPVTRGGIPRKDAASSSKLIKPGRRF